MPQTISQISKAIASALARRIPFVCYCLPDEKEPVFFADPADIELKTRSDRSFRICRWDDQAPCAQIRDVWSDEDLLKHGDSFPPAHATEFTPPSESTPKARYIADLEKIIARLRLSGGKVVISRVEVESDERFTPEHFANTAVRLFEAYPAAFRHIYYTPQTGAWIGATPELLVDVDKKVSTFSTMALAGTIHASSHQNVGTDPGASATSPLSPTDRSSNRAIECSTELWDSKNLAEHRFVIDGIISSLASIGIEASASPTESVRSGNLLHLRTPISGSTAGRETSEIIAAIHPTPAISGFPKREAIDVISATERHPRGCYGGYVMLSAAERDRAYVNLRCMAIAPGLSCHYGGGGIVADSDPETEWAEAGMKIGATRRYI